MDLGYMKGDKVPKGTPKGAVASSLAKKPPSKTVENDGKTPLGDKVSTASGLSIKNVLGVPHWGLDFLNMRDPRPLQTTARSVPPKWEAREKKKPEVCADELGRTHGSTEPCATYRSIRPSEEDFDIPEETFDPLNDSMEDEKDHEIDPLKDDAVRDPQEAMADIDFLATEEGLREFKRAMIDPTVLLPRNITEEEEDLLASFDVLVIDPDFPDMTFVYDKQKGKMVYCE